MPLYDEKLRAVFNAKNGAFSAVTDREATGDKSVTVDRNEKQILSSKYPLDIFTRAGGSEADHKPASHIFNILNVENMEYSQQELAIKYPKAKGNELRLYFKSGSGFYPGAGTIWFIFTREDSDYPFIGFTNSNRWASLSHVVDRLKAFDIATTIDEDDMAYQTLLSQPEEKRDAQERTQSHYPRSASKAKNKAQSVGYKCEFNNEHASFLSATTGKLFVEAHHLIPISKSDDFDTSLDVTANIIILCPNCHRAIHFGDEPTKRQYLEKFYTERNLDLVASGINITIEELLNYYGI
jgi:5-methylcytosine-specific restriction protein A